MARAGLAAGPAIQAGGSVPFSTYMAWVLHDPEHGAYGSGRLRIGPRGDFATAPSLGAEFAALLAPQLAQWLERPAAQDGPLALVETGPGEGQLALQLAQALQTALAPPWPPAPSWCWWSPMPAWPASGSGWLMPPLPVRWPIFEHLAAAACAWGGAGP